MKNEKLFLSPSDVGEILGVTGQTVVKWIYGGKLKAFRPFGKRMLVRKSELDAFIDSMERVKPKDDL